MNWYKTAKMVDVGDKVPTYIYCPSCKSLATESIAGESWKPYFQMTPQEQAQIDKAKSTGEVKFISKICPKCKKENII